MSRGQEELRKKLGEYYEVVSAIVLEKQNPVTGLCPASTAITSHGDYTDAWVRDNVYSILCVWALALAYEKVDYDQGRTYSLKHSVVKLMRGLLFSMMRQTPKVEKFKFTQNPLDSLHAKYNTTTCDTVVGDNEWGHLQLDATSLFLLTLAQMTQSGLQIIYTPDEVDFIQNLVFYIETAYRTPDFGVWERGNKANDGKPELNSSSIGMVTAALEAMNGLNLFGSTGAEDSVIHVIPDEISRNYTILQTFLPRESNSKEIDAGVLAVIGYPAFACGSTEIIQKTLTEIQTKLEGTYGCKRFLLDGHQCVVEDTTRLHYQPHELKIFRGIECEWPLFFTYLVLNGLFSGNISEAERYREKLENTLVVRELHGIEAKLVPELYYVPEESIEEERKNPGSQTRLPNDNVPLVWAQSLMIVGDLILDDLITVGEIDPLGRRFRPYREKKDILVQIVLLSENEAVQRELNEFGIETETISQISPIKIFPSSTLCELYRSLGKNRKLSLSGRPNLRIGSLGTSKIYRIQGKLCAFTPTFLEAQSFYFTSDNEILTGTFRDELQFVRRNWNFPGRPTMSILLTPIMLRSANRSNLMNFISSLRSGVCNNVRVKIGRMKEMVNSSYVDNLDFITKLSPLENIWESVFHPISHLKGGERNQRHHTRRERKSTIDLFNRRRSSLHEIMNYDPDAVQPTTQELEEISRLMSQQTLEQCIQSLKESQNIFVQIDYLEYILSATNLDYMVEELATVRELLNEIYRKAIHESHWSIVRQAAFLLHMYPEDLSSNLVELLIRQKVLLIGTTKQFLIDEPYTPDDLLKLISKYHRNEDVRECILVEEIIIFLSSFIRATPIIFQGISRINIGFLLKMIPIIYASKKNVSIEEAEENMFHLSPSQIKKLIYSIFNSTLKSQEIESMNCDFDDLKNSGIIFSPSANDVPLEQIGEGSLLSLVYGAAKEFEIEISVQSAGFIDGNFGVVKIDGKVEFEMERRGIAVVVINEETGKIETSATFDTHLSKDASTSFKDFILSNKNDSILVFMVRDEGSQNLEEPAILALESLGSLRFRELSFRASWAMIWSKDEIIESIKKAGEGPTDVITKSLEVWTGHNTAFLKPFGGEWYKKRYAEGGLGKISEECYSSTFLSLIRTKPGLFLKDSLLPRDPTVSDMTPGEWNFARKFQHWLDNEPNFGERQLIIECLMTLAELYEKNPETKIGEEIHIDQILEDAIQICWETFQPDPDYKAENYPLIAKHFFLDLPILGVHGTKAFTLAAITKRYPIFENPN